MKKNLFFIFTLILLGCDAQRALRHGVINKVTSTPPPGVGGGTSSLSTIYNAELMNIGDPQDGAFRTKVTIPKNYGGYLYLSGLNITSMNDKLVKVRFKFGQGYAPVTLDTVITEMQGATPYVRIPVIAVNLTSRPFANLRLPYDLYDYTTYNFSAGDEPVVDNRHPNLFCRGVNLQDDPTFNGSSLNPLCDSATSVCKYTYAKIFDQGLVHPSTGVPRLPTQPQISLISGTPYNSDSATNKMKKCLPDDGKIQRTGSSGSYVLTAFGSSGSLVSYGAAAQTLSGVDYLFKGPYLPVNEAGWGISDDAIFNTDGYGIFLDNLAPTQDAAHGIQSLMFPRYGKMNLNSGIDHLSATLPDDSKEISALLAAGETEFMDGCNLRATSYDAFTGEHMGSCTITGVIELITIDNTTGEENLLSTSYEVKLQLVRTNSYANDGTAVGYHSMPTCSSSLSCAADSCCVGGHCFEKSLVGGVCPEDALAVDNLSVGEACTSDRQCSSLCCSGFGVCAVHDNRSNILNPTLCNKSMGQPCFGTEWCQEVPVRRCLIVRTGPGASDCALHCYNEMMHGRCEVPSSVLGQGNITTQGYCVAPPTPIDPVFDPAHPDCSNAVNPPLVLP